MTDDTPNIIYLVLLLVLVGSSLMARQLPIKQSLKMALAWVGIFGLVFIVVAFRHDFGDLAKRLRTELTGAPVTTGSMVRIPQANDGHFWVDASINGEPVRFLVDSGATVTTVSSNVASRAKLPIGFRAEEVNTANGTVVMKKSRADTLQVGTIERQDIGVDVSEQDNLNVLGMNFLSSLSAWRVEGRTLVLEP